MSKPHHPRAPSRPGARRTQQANAALDARRHRRRYGGESLANRTGVGALPGEPCEHALEVVRERRDRQDRDDHGRSEDRRDEREAGRRRAREKAPVEAEAEDHERGHIDAVEERVEGSHLGGDLTPAQPEPPQGPRGQRDSAGAGDGEQAGRGDTRHRDPVARRPIDPRRRRAEHGSKVDRVGREREHLEQQRRQQPDRLARGEPGPGLVEARDRRHDDIEQREHDDEPEAEHSQGPDPGRPQELPPRGIDVHGCAASIPARRRSSQRRSSSAPQTMNGNGATKSSMCGSSDAVASRSWNSGA